MYVITLMEKTSFSAFCTNQSDAHRSVWANLSDIKPKKNSRKYVEI